MRPKAEWRENADPTGTLDGQIPPANHPLPLKNTKNLNPYVDMTILMTTPA